MLRTLWNIGGGSAGAATLIMNSLYWMLIRANPGIPWSNVAEPSWMWWTVSSPLFLVPTAVLGMTGAVLGVWTGSVIATVREQMAHQAQGVCTNVRLSHWILVVAGWGTANLTGWYLYEQWPLYPYHNSRIELLVVCSCCLLVSGWQVRQGCSTIQRLCQ